MRGLHAGGLPANDLRKIFRQIAGHRLLVALLGVVLARFHRLQNRMITGAESSFGIDPGPAQRCAGRSGNFLVGLAEPDEFRFQFASEARALQTLLVKIRLQVRAFHVSCGVLIAFLPVFAGFDKIFQHADCIFFIHNSLRSLDAASQPRFGRIRRLGN